MFVLLLDSNVYKIYYTFLGLILNYQFLFENIYFLDELFTSVKVLAYILNNSFSKKLLFRN